MHDPQGFSCKNALLWKNRQIVDLKKTEAGRIGLGQQCTAGFSPSGPLPKAVETAGRATGPGAGPWGASAHAGPTREALFLLVPARTERQRRQRRRTPARAQQRRGGRGDMEMAGSGRAGSIPAGSNGGSSWASAREPWWRR